jgi:hypothetical protein
VGLADLFLTHIKQALSCPRQLTPCITRPRRAYAALARQPSVALRDRVEPAPPLAGWPFPWPQLRFPMGEHDAGNWRLIFTTTAMISPRHRLQFDLLTSIVCVVRGGRLMG